jgi:hypothetical protein
MIEAVEPLSLVLWGVFFLAAGMYPLGFMLGAPCSPCCDSSTGCEPLFHRCLRELSVNGSDPAKALYVPSREIFRHAEAALVKASEKAVVNVTITIPSLAAVHLNPGEQLVYSAGLTLSMGSEQWNAVIPNDAKSKDITITLVGRAIDQSDPAYQAVVPAVVSGTGVTAYASLESQVVTITGVEFDLKNTLGSTCTTTTCWAVVNMAGLVKVSGRERPVRPDFFRPAIAGSITDLALDRWVVNGTVMLDGFQLRELDFDKAEQFRNGEIALRKRRATDYVDVKLAEYSPLCAMPLCYLNGVQTTIPEDLLPTGITYTPAAGEKYGCKEGYEFVLGPDVAKAPYNMYGNQSSACSYSHATNECNGVVSKSVSLLEFWKQYSLDPATNGRSTMGGWSYYCVPDILTWMEYQPQPLVKYGATYTVGGTYDPAKGRYGKCLNGGVAYLPDINGTCHPSELSVTLSSLTYSGTPGGTQDERDSIEFISSKLNEFAGTYVLSPAGQPKCTTLSYQGGKVGELVTSVYPTGLYSFNNYLSVSATRNSVSTGNGKRGFAAGCDRSEEFDSVSFVGRLYLTTSASGYKLPKGDNSFLISSLANFPQSFNELNWTQFGNIVLYAQYRNLFGDYFSWPFTVTASKSNGNAMSQCSNVSYTPAEFTIDNTALVDRRTYGGIYSYIWGNALGATLTATTSPTGNHQLCGGATTTFGPFNNDRSQDRVYTRYAYSDGSSPTPITVTVKGTCIAYPVGLYEARTYFNQVSGEEYYTIAYYGLYCGYPQDYEGGGCVMVPIKANGTECEWSVTSNNDWLTFAKDIDTGTGDGRVNVLMAALPSNVYAREGSLSLLCNGKTTTIKVRQGGSQFG